MTNLETIEILSVFEGLTKDEKEKIAKIAKIKRLKKESILFRKGDLKREFLVIVDGMIEIYKELDLKTQTLAIFKQNQFLSEAAIIGNGEAKHFHSGRAMEQSEVLVIEDEDWFGVFGNNHKATKTVLENIVRELQERLFHANNKLVGFFQVSEIIGKYGDDSERLISEVFKVTVEITPCKKALLALFQQSTNKIIIKEAKGYPKPKKIIGLQIPKDDSIMEEVMRKKESLIINLSGEIGQENQYGKDSVLVCPIVIGEKFLGVIVLGDKLNGHDFNLNNQILVELIGRQLGLAILQAETAEDEKRQEELKRVYVG